MSESALSLDYIKELVSVNDSYEDIQKQGRAFQKKTVESLVAFSYCVHVLKMRCEAEGDQDFVALAAEYWGLSASGASQTAKVGKHSDRFLEVANMLPASARVLYELTSIPKKQIQTSIDEGLITPNMTTDEAKSLKAIVKPKKKKEEPKEEENPFHEPELSNEDVEQLQDKEEESLIIEGAFTEEPKEKVVMTVKQALIILGVNIDQAFEEALLLKKHSIEQLDDAYQTLVGEDT